MGVCIVSLTCTDLSSCVSSANLSICHLVRHNLHQSLNSCCGAPVKSMSNGIRTSIHEIERHEDTVLKDGISSHHLI